MQRIIAPLRPGDRNDAVANLQDALRLLVDCGCITLDPAECDSLMDALGHEHGDLVYAATTRMLVILFRIQHGLNDLDWVDDPTAAVLNDVLRELGALDNGLPVPERIVAGQVVSSTTLNVLLEDQAASALQSEEELKMTMQEGKLKDYKDCVKQPY